MQLQTVWFQIDIVNDPNSSKCVYILPDSQISGYTLMRIRTPCQRREASYYSRGRKRIVAVSCLRDSTHRPRIPSLFRVQLHRSLTVLHVFIYDEKWVSITMTLKTN